MHAVVNHLELAHPLPDAALEAAGAAGQALLDAGGLAFHVVRVSETHLILVLFFETAEDADRIAREVGGPWMREHVVAHLANGTQRHLGEVVLSTTR